MDHAEWLRSFEAVAGAVVSLGISVSLAVRGHRHWSLVWGQLAGALVTTVLLFALSLNLVHALRAA